MGSVSESIPSGAIIVSLAQQNMYFVPSTCFVLQWTKCRRGSCPFRAYFVRDSLWPVNLNIEVLVDRLQRVSIVRINKTIVLVADEP